MSCRDSPSNAHWNNLTNTPDQSAVSGPLLTALLTYIIVGAITSVCNVVCILVFITKKELREKYLLFAALAFGSLINTLFMFVAGIFRRHLIFNNQYMQLISTVECLRYPTPHLQLFGGQLPVVMILAIDVERFIAVYRPIFYKVRINYRARIFIVLFCFTIVVVSQLFGYLSSYLNRNVCTTSLCPIAGAYGVKYSYFNSFIVILFPVCALILNISTYIGAKKSVAHASVKKELNLLLITLIITFLDVILIAIPNLIIFGTNNGFVSVASATVINFYLFFCSNSAINLFVYIAFRRDFRHHLLFLFSFGASKPHLEVLNDTKMGHNTRRVAHWNSN